MKKTFLIIFSVLSAVLTFAEPTKQSVDYSQISVAELESKAMGADLQACFLLGSYYAKGEAGLKPDGQKAVALLTKSAEGGVAGAQAYLGYIYGEGRLVQRNFDLAVYWRELAAANGSTADKWSLGNAFLYGFFLPKDQIKALFWISQAAEEGDANAILKLIEIFENLKNEEQLAKWKAKFASMELEAAKKGNVDAMAAVAKKYMGGKDGLPRNRPQAVYWYLLAADKGNIAAMERVAKMYATGRFLPKNPEKAQFYFEKLAQNDNTYSLKLASLYAEGAEDFPKDAALAAKWYEIAAQNSDISTQAHLAWKYWAGSGVPQDTVKALEWCSKIIEKIPSDASYKRSQMEDFSIMMAGDIGAGKSAPLDFGEYVKSANSRKK